MKWALERRTPDKFPLTGAGALKNNFYSVTVNDPISNFWMLVLEIKDDALIGSTLFDRVTPVPCCLHTSQLASVDFEIIHYYKSSRTTFKRLATAWLARLLRLAELKHLLDAAQQGIFNIRAKFRRERVEVLRFLVELDLSSERGFPDQEASWSSFSIFERLNGIRAFAHPDFNREMRRLTLILDSLQATGEIETDESKSRYRLTGRALETLSSFELEERRHHDALKQNRRLVWLTVVLALSAIAQAVLTGASLDH